MLLERQGKREIKMEELADHPANSESSVTSPTTTKEETAKQRAKDGQNSVKEPVRERGKKQQHHQQQQTKKDEGKAKIVGKESSPSDRTTSKMEKGREDKKEKRDERGKGEIIEY